MSQLRARVDEQVQEELDRAGIKDIEGGMAARSGYADPIALLVSTIFQREVEAWLRTCRAAGPIAAQYYLSEMIEEFTS